MTFGEDILYLITPRNLEIHLVKWLCCCEVFFGMRLLTSLQCWLTFQVDGNMFRIERLWISGLCTSVLSQSLFAPLSEHHSFRRFSDNVYNFF